MAYIQAPVFTDQFELRSLHPWEYSIYRELPARVSNPSIKAVAEEFSTNMGRNHHLAFFIPFLTEWSATDAVLKQMAAATAAGDFVFDFNKLSPEQQGRAQSLIQESKGDFNAISRETRGVAHD